MKNKIKNMVRSIKRAYEDGLVSKIRLATSMVCKIACLISLYCTGSLYENSNIHLCIIFGIISAVLFITDTLLVNPGIVLLLPYVMVASYVVFAYHHNLMRFGNDTRREYVLLYEECEGRIDWLDELYYRWQHSEIVNKYKLY